MSNNHSGRFKALQAVLGNVPKILHPKGVKTRLGAILALVGLSTLIFSPASAQQAPKAISSVDINSTAAAGTSQFLALDGQYSTCTVTAFTSTSTASIVVDGNTQATQYGPAAPYSTNTNFGSSGTISVTTAASTSTGNVANLPVAIFFTWSGNTGTLHAWMTCSNGLGAVITNNGGGGVAANVTIVGPTNASNQVIVTDPKATTAVSPAPAAIKAVGYGAGGATAPIICTHTAAVSLVTTQATETVMVPSAAGKIIYICSVIMTGNVSAGTAPFGLYTSATNVCGSPTALIQGSAASNTAGQSYLGTGVGLVGITSAGVALCFLNPTTTPTAGTAEIMYEQFLHSLSAQQLADFCSVPKRCLLYGLFKKLNAQMNGALIP